VRAYIKGKRHRLASVLDALLPAFPYHNNARQHMQNASKTVACDVIIRQRLFFFFFFFFFFKFLI
jgi:hypothetical protein